MRDVELSSRCVLAHCFSPSCCSTYLECLREVNVEAIHPHHRSIFRAIVDFEPFEGGFSDLSVIAAKIRSMGLKLGIEILSDVALTTTTEQSALQCIDIIEEIYNQKKVVRKLKTLSDECYQITSSSELRLWAETTQHAIADDLACFVRSPTTEIALVLGEAISGLETASESIIPTGFRAVDELSGGLERGSVTIIAGRPSMGKTSYAVCQALRSSYFGNRGLIFSLEMSKIQIGQKMMSIAAKLPINALRGKMDIATSVARHISTLPIEIIDESNLSIEDICAIVSKKSVDYIVIDYLQLIRATTGMQSREREVSHISQRLKSLAKSGNCCVVALSQLNREVDKRPDKRPKPSDLRDSGSLEQDADVIGFVYRDSVYNQDALTDQSELIIAKNRTGKTGTAHLKWDAECTRFYE